MRTIILVMAFLLLVVAASATHYQIKDEDGNVLYGVDITHSPEVPNLDTYLGLNISVNGSDGKPVSDASISISGFDETQISVRTVAGTTKTARGILPCDICIIRDSRTRDVAKLIFSVNQRGPLIYEFSVSHRFPNIPEQSIVSAMCGAISFTGAASAAVGGNGEWTSFGNNFVVAMLNTNMDATAGSSAGHAQDTSIAGSACGNASGVQTNTANTVFLPADGCILPTLYIVNKSSNLQIEAQINGQFHANPARCGSAAASTSLFCPSGKKPLRLEFSQSDTSEDFSDGNTAYEHVSKDTVLKSSRIANSEFVSGNAASGATMTMGEGGASASGVGKFQNITVLTALPYSKPPAVEP